MGVHVAFRGSGGADSLIGPDVANTWNITANSAGQLVSPDGTLHFAGVERLFGGSDGDDYKFANGKRFGGLLDGRGGHTRSTSPRTPLR